MIAVTFALPAESRAFIRLVRQRSESGFMTSGTLHGNEVRVAHTGVGEKMARARLAVFFRDETPRLLISAGFAGAVSDELHAGDLLLAENFSEPGALSSATAALGAMKPRTGKLSTANAVIDVPAERSELARRSGAVAVDMETSFIAEACAQRHIAMLSLRAISDTPAAPLPAPADVLFNIERQKTEFPALAYHMLTHPAAIAGMVAFARQIALARRSLTAALELLLRRVP